MGERNHHGLPGCTCPPFKNSSDDWLSGIRCGADSCKAADKAWRSNRYRIVFNPNLLGGVWALIETKNYNPIPRTHYYNPDARSDLVPPVMGWVCVLETVQNPACQLKYLSTADYGNNADYGNIFSAAPAQ